MPLLSYQQRPPAVLSSVVLGSDSAVGQTGEILRQQFENDALRESTGSILKFEKGLLLSARKKVVVLLRLTNDWDSYGAPAPNGSAAANALRVLDRLHDELALARVLPSAEGGIGICFFHNDRYADIECSNQGEFIGVYYTGTEMPKVLGIEGTDESIEAALNEIRNHLIG